MTGNDERLTDTDAGVLAIMPYFVSNPMKGLREIMKRLTSTLSFSLTALLMVVCPVAMATMDSGSPAHPIRSK
jgi:branched-subunit amino acid transport protein AzlD